MIVHKDIADFTPHGPVVLTQGTFDGVHYGHRAILRRLVEQARALGGESVLLTFYPHPRLVLYPNDNDLKLLNTLDEKIELLEELGVDHLVVLPFTTEFSRLDAETFVHHILVEHLKVSRLVIGYDHRFGKHRSGDIQDMRRLASKFGFRVEEIPAQDVDHSIVSSTKIRKALLNGEVEQATQLLGRPYTLSGLVVEGSKRGKEIGYPTANIEPDSPYKLVPGNGVYAVRVKLDGRSYGGMLNIGDNPTFHDKKWSIEVHIFEFDKKIYKESIELTFIKRLRSEKRFAQVAELIEQMKDDEKKSKEILERH